MDRSSEKRERRMLRLIAVRLPALLLALALAACPTRPVIASDDAAGIAFFESKIRPVLVERCYECHSSQAKKLRGGLRLDTRAGTRDGGAGGPAVVPGNVDESLLFSAISAAKDAVPMPPEGRLPESVVA